MSNKKLYEHEINQLVQEYVSCSDITCEQLGIKYNRSTVSIAKYLRTNIEPELYENLKLLRNPTYPGKDIVEQKRLTLILKREERKNRVDHNSFSRPLNKEKAYWIGFLFADGCISDRHRVQLGLQETDIGHIKKFQQFVKGDFYKITNIVSNKSCSFKFVSEKISNDLATYGVVPRKTLTDNFALNIPNEFIFDYLRGFFDGDGSFHIDTRGRWVVQLPGSYEFCIKLMHCLKQKSIHSIGPYKTNSNVFLVQIQSDNAQNILYKIYENSNYLTRLDRKYEKYQTGVLNGY